jgi:hypothetical protein
MSLDLATHPMIITTILIELMADYYFRLLEKRDQGLTLIEFETGMRHGFSEDIHRNGTKKERLAKRAQLDFDLKTQQLTGLAGTLAFCHLSLDLAMRSLALIEEVSLAMHTGAKVPTLPHPLSQRMKSLNALITGAQSHCLLLQERKEAQVLTVYSLVAQKDAAAMTTIAYHTRRDSIEMRIMTAVALLFLPATAVAVSLIPTSSTFETIR